ncbi:phage tail protein [Burkholderia ubonensis]|uniref:tail fiber assembly protein n=1 Tax=Burkholderia ubonensis TaxID=101571 RepID=UPI000758B0E2|nr:tail fiber assembly protein [Burkholderia ubonensis]KVC88160.1 phage tail protein [Burkholderia ubonensis]
MLIHQYDAQTGQYISSHLADADPKQPDRWLVPAFSTTDKLPARPPLTWPFYVDGAWELRPDYRGQMLYRQDNGEPAEILTAGATPDQHGLTATPRPSADHVWRNGAWAIDPTRVAQRARDVAMAEFEAHMTRARLQNAGKADAYAAGLLSREEVYYFRAWSAYQLDLVRTIQSAGFPDAVQWPDEPSSFEIACGPALAEYDARLTRAKPFTDGKAEAHAAGKLSAEDEHNYRVWTAYADQLARAIDRESFPHAIAWPDEPAPYVAPPALEPSARDARAADTKPASGGTAP